ncbi:MAG: AAA family ATPase [Victivallaceae bacterium]|nr:AAA family ATPase [Victivallaceae bacterium]
MYLNARRPIIYIRNFDFQAVDSLIAEVCGEDYVIDEYSEAGGRIDFKTKSPKTKNPISLAEYLSIFNSSSFNNDKHQYLVVLKEVHAQLDDPKVYSILQTIAQRVKMSDEDVTHQNKYDVTVVIADSKMVIPQELEKLITLVDMKLPDDDDIRRIVEEMAKTNKAYIEDGFMPDLIMALKGLSEFEIRQIVNLAIADDGCLDQNDLELINNEKRQAIQKSGLIEMIEVGNVQTAGLKKLLNYIKLNGPIFKNPGRAQEYGVGLPAGVMIVGMPGCGKSLTSKCIAKEFEVPLLKLDVGRLMGKYVGESEENMRRAIAVAESAAPCILWIDEIEKAFAGIGESGGGSVTTRMFGYFLTWMQEKKSCIYVVATANDISNLPPEFLRRGRFDEIFQVKFPTKEERKEIFALHLKKRNKGVLPQGIDPEKLAGLLRDDENYSGADIESMVKEGMKQLFVRNITSGLDPKLWKTLSQSDMEKIIRETPSSYHSQKAKLDKMLQKLKELDVKSAT